MKLDASALRYLTAEDFRILSALEIASKNHEVVPLKMLAKLARIRPGGVNSRLSELAKYGLVSKEHHTYEGFRLTYGGYDYLALRALSMRGSVEAVGRQIGVGKESDVYLVSGRHLPPVSEQDNDNDSDNDNGSDEDMTFKRREEEENDDERPLLELVLKIERLGRTSFRTIKNNRDYIGKRKHISWMYMSRLAAQKEWSFMKALYSHGFPTPKPIDWSRHCLVMEYIDGRILEQLHPDDWTDCNISLISIAAYLYDELIKILVRLAEHGLIHGDFNEFNIMIKQSFIDDPSLYINRADSLDNQTSSSPSTDEQKEKGAITMIDFPQMVSTCHANASDLFDRDVTCLRLFFKKRFGFEPMEWPVLDSIICNDNTLSLDSELKASGYHGNNKNNENEEEEGEEEEEEEGENDSEQDENKDEQDEDEEEKESNDTDSDSESNDIN